MTDDREPVSAAEVHRRLVEAYGDVLAGRLDEALELIDPDVVDHRGGIFGDYHGREAWRRTWESVAENGFRNVSVTIEQNASDGEMSVNRYISRGVHRATGRHYEILTIDMVRVREGRVVEHWTLRDVDAMRNQLTR